MEYLKFILYGLIQGLTEFIPVSSTAHLKVISLLLGIDDPGSSLSAIIQLGSILALFWYFRNDFFKLRRQSTKNLFDYFLHQRLLRSILIGVSQAFAILPGVSRSGITISTALVTGWERVDAAKFSFILGIPAISIAAIVEFISSFDELYSFSFFPLLFGLFTTFLSSLFAIDFLLKYFSSNGLKLFIIYRVVFGVVILLNL